MFNINYHMNSHMDQKQERIICDICGKSFSCTQSHFRHHKTEHTAREHYLCEICGKSFKYYEAFKIHEKIHICKNSYNCPSCGKEFLVKAYMRKHFKRHHNQFGI